MKTNHYLFLALLAAVLAGCRNRETPCFNLPSQPFQFSISEQRELKTFTWTKEQLQGGGLYVTKYNSITLTSTAPVNVKAEPSGIVSVSRIGEDNQTFSLSFRAGGSCSITLWNGEGNATVQSSFPLNAKECIDIEGLVFNYAGEPLIIHHYTSSRPFLCCTPEDFESGNEDKSRPTLSDFQVRPYEKPNIWSEDRQEFVPDPDQGVVLRFEGLYPENCSFRTVLAFESEWDYYMGLTSYYNAAYPESRNHGSWPNVRNIRKDVSEFVGTDSWVASGLGMPTYIACIRVPVAGGDRYYYLYYYRDMRDGTEPLNPNR